LEIIPPCDSSLVKYFRPIGSDPTSAVHALRQLDAPTHKTKSPPMRWSASPLPRTYFPDHAQNRMQSEGDLLAAHTEFLAKRPKNLQLLLKNRYSWMQKYIKPDSIVVEIGAGSGFSKQFIEREILLTEIFPHPWIDICVDAADMPFGPETIDVVICANVLHHLGKPLKFLLDLHKCLKPGGYVLINEANPSFLFLLAVRAMRHEGWSFDVDVFDLSAPVNDPADPWSGNNAVSYLMFHESRAFQEKVRGFEVVHDGFAECLMLPLSGGVTAKTKTVELPMTVLKIVDWLDRKLCRLSPEVFAMRRSVALRKRSV
jgi:SAM-dependent methyltransferase